MNCNWNTLFGEHVRRTVTSTAIVTATMKPPSKSARRRCRGVWRAPPLSVIRRSPAAFLFAAVCLAVAATTEPSDHLRQQSHRDLLIPLKKLSSSSAGKEADVDGGTVPRRTQLSANDVLDATKRCPRSCVCSATTVICTGQALTTVPRGLPPDTVRLDLQENKISTIKRDDFAGLSKLKILQLMDNEIQLIEENAFDNLTSLERLRINRNRLRTIPDHLFQYNAKLHRLDLSENQLSGLTDDQLHGPVAMHNLQLDRNQLTCLDTQQIAGEWAATLEILTLNGNSLTTLGALAAPAPQLRVLRLNDNPWHCDCRLRWLKRAEWKSITAANIKCHRPVMLQGRYIDGIDVQQMKCSGIEKRAATSCREAAVCPSVCTCVDTTVDCHDRGLKHIPANLPPTTTELRLEQNHISFIPNNAFQNLRKLVRLDLSKNNIGEIAGHAFTGLSSLNTLMLFANNLTELPAEVFAPLTSLQLLLLNTNKLQCLRTAVFSGLKKLNLLSLYDNQLRSLANGTFADLQSLQTLHLARNPLICDCNLEWLGALLTRRPIETSGARCRSPARLERRRLGTIAASKFRCRGSESFVTREAGKCFIDNECPPECFCHHTIVDCRRIMSNAINNCIYYSGRGLTAIPSNLPRFATQLLLNGNDLRAINTSLAFSGLINIEKLDLSNNRISTIERNALTGMRALRELNLTGNRLRHFDASMCGESAASLHVLRLGANSLQCVTLSTFGAFSNLRLLTLADNQIRSITEDAFSNLTKLHTLHVAGNPLVCNCHLANFVQFCRKNPTLLRKKLPNQRLPHCAEPITLKERALESLNVDELKCADGEEENVCTPDGNYCPMGCACSDSVVRCTNRRLTTFPRVIPPTTVELYLDNNAIEEIALDVLANLTNLVKLDLSHNRISVIESDTFAANPRLSTLILSYNRIRCVEEAAFRGLRSLRILSLHGNAIAVLPESAFADLGNLSHVALGSNALYCDCRMAWFSRWIKQRFVEPGIARCEAPPPMSNQLLLTASASQFGCNEKPILVPEEVAAKCDACASRPCANGSQCRRKLRRNKRQNLLDVEIVPLNGEIDVKDGIFGGGSLRFECQCAPGFYGARCERSIDACYGDPCLNSGHCEAVADGRFRCECAKGFTGERCETNIDDCVANKCLNGATCVDEVNSYRCQCPARHVGRYCEERLAYCSAQLNPCANDARCVPSDASGSDYSCVCGAPFSGRNCSERVDMPPKVERRLPEASALVSAVSSALANRRDLSNHYYRTMDGHPDEVDLNTVDLELTNPNGASGRKLVEGERQHLGTGDAETNRQCSPLNCENGYCEFTTPSSDDDNGDEDYDGGAASPARCSCFHGYGGARCHRQTSVSFTDESAYVELTGSWPADADGRRNLTMTLRTLNSSGVLLYFGDFAYVALELFDGRVAATFYIGNYPSSHLYSYAVVNDGQPHRLELLIRDNRLTLLVDDRPSQQVANSGKVDVFTTRDRPGLYLGGIPRAVSVKALAGFHLKETRSLRGCLSDVHVNANSIDLTPRADGRVRARNTSMGCAPVFNLCRGVDCNGSNGRCVLNATVADGFQCKCSPGFTGLRCERRVIQCVKEKFREHYVEGECRSVERIKSARCVGWCGSAADDVDTRPTVARWRTRKAATGDAEAACCATVRAKRRRVKMHCRSGAVRVRTAWVTVVRKCACRNDCATTTPFVF